jgi:hypothetical protein
MKKKEEIPCSEVREEMGSRNMASPVMNGHFRGVREAQIP